MASAHAHVQSPDPSSRPGALLADPGRRQAGRYRSGSSCRCDDRAPRHRPGKRRCRISRPNCCADCGTSRSLGADVRPGRARAQDAARRARADRPRPRRAASSRLRDICPHRGIPLHYGRFDGETIACCYHGWRFDHRPAPASRFRRCAKARRSTSPRFAAAPTLASSGKAWCGSISRARTRPTAEPAEPPRMPVFSDAARRRPPSCSRFPARPTTPPSASWTRPMPASCTRRGGSSTQATKLRPKEKQFEPIELGWRMVRHPLPPQNLVYKLLGRNVETEISYQLPGLRIEEVHGDRHAVVGLTAITPITDEATEVHQIFWASPRWVAPLSPAHQAVHAHLPRPGPASRRAPARGPRAQAAADAHQRRGYAGALVDARQGRMDRGAGRKGAPSSIRSSPRPCAGAAEQNR